MERATHSHEWDRIASLRVRLRSSVVVRRRHFRRRRGYVLSDPAANQFYRLDPVTYHLVALFDGRRTVEQAWTLCMEQFGDRAPTQGEVFALISQLYQTSLVTVDGTTDAAQLFKRMQRRRSVMRRKQWSSFLFVKVPLFDPAAAIDALLPVVRPLLSRWGLLAWIALLLAALVRLAPRWSTLWEQTTLMIRPGNVLWLGVLFVLIKVVHEFGHGLMCRRFGGQVHEMGVMLLVFAPVPYCDATSSWGLESRLQRALVGLAGIIVETAVAALAVFVWAGTAPGVVNELAHRTIFVSGVATLLFNANPLLRFDGYYVLTDLLDIPNLLKNANAQLQQVLQRCFYGLRDLRPVAHSRTERSWLLTYAVSAWTYRAFIMVAIAWFVSRLFFGLGVLLVTILLLTWVIVPLAKLTRFLAVSPMLHGRRGRAWASTCGAVAGVVAVVGLLPVGRHAYVDAVIEPEDWMELVMSVDGFVERVALDDGQPVDADQVILEATNRDLALERERLVAKMVHEKLLADAAGGEGFHDEKDKALARLASLEGQLAEVDRRIQDLTLTSPGAGQLVAPALSVLQGQYLERGEVLGRVHAGNERLVAIAIIDQKHNSLLFGESAAPAVQLRPIGRIDQVLDGKVERVSPSGTQQLRHRMFGYYGGGSLRTDARGFEAAESVFEVRISLPDDVAVQPGQRAKVRFTFGRTSLAARWWRRFLQAVDTA
ncbi:MAG: hypothetical protein CMJ18_25655 [Phycisphaeraceae bacterium]|nr:hypothetical protein [Phycisphaeraceae bacterium]